MKFASSIVLFFLAATTTFGQIATGGGYILEKSVVATGGAESAGGTYAVSGTIAQPVAGDPSIATGYIVQHGFWVRDLVPTAAGVSIEGRVVSVFGSPIGMSTILLSDVEGNTRVAITNPFGRFRFEGVEAGRGYFIIAKAKGLSSDPRFINADQDVTGIELIAFEQ